MIKAYGPKKLKKINKFVFQQCQIEKEMLLNNPEIVINKIRNVLVEFIGLHWVKSNIRHLNIFFN